MPTNTRRLFIGLQPPPQAAERLASRVRRVLGEPQGTQLYSPEDLHLTLVFLGHLPDQDVGPLQESLKAEIRGMNAPELALCGCGAHPSEAAPRALWAGVTEEGEGQGRLLALRNRALQAALSLGWRQPAAERKRPFRPHLTVARVGAGAEVQHFLDQDWTGSWLPVDVTLFESLGPGGASRYRALASHPLVVRPG